jgi:hypothetical protein
VFGSRVVEGIVAETRQSSGLLYNPSFGELSIEPVSSLLVTLIRQTNRVLGSLAVFQKDVKIPTLLSLTLNMKTHYAIKLANDTDMKIHAPLSLKSGVVTPAMTLDELGLNAVYLQRVGCGDAGADMSFLRPCHGGDVAVDVNVVSVSKVYSV